MVRYTVYVVRCADGTLYSGYTTDVERRIAEHNSGVGSRYTRSRVPVVLVYTEIFRDRRSAMKREVEIKKMKRKDKLLLFAPGDSQEQHTH